MPKPQPKANKLHQQILAGLIEVTPASWQQKSLSKDESGKEVVVTSKVTHRVLRYPLAQNVSSLSVERAARKWI